MERVNTSRRGSEELITAPRKFLPFPSRLGVCFGNKVTNGLTIYPKRNAGLSDRSHKINKLRETREGKAKAKR